MAKDLIDYLYERSSERYLPKLEELYLGKKPYKGRVELDKAGQYQLSSFDLQEVFTDDDELDEEAYIVTKNGKVIYVSLDYMEAVETFWSYTRRYR